MAFITNQAHCHCQHCNQDLLFDRARAGEHETCPGCGLETLLFVPANSRGPLPERRGNGRPASKLKQFLLGIIAAFVMLFGGIIGLMIFGVAIFWIIAIILAIAMGILLGIYILSRINKPTK